MRSMASALSLLGDGIAGKLLPDSTQKDQVQEAFGSVAEMVKTVTRQSDEMRTAASMAMMAAAKTVQNPRKRGDLQAVSDALVDVMTAIGVSLQSAAARKQAKKTAGLLIDHLAVCLGSAGVQDGSVDPVKAMRDALADSPVRLTDLLGEALKDPRTLLTGRQAVGSLRYLLIPAAAGDRQQSALGDGLRSLGRMWQTPRQRQTVKTAVHALIEAVSTAGTQLKKNDTQGAVKGGVCLLIEGIGQHLSAGRSHAGNGRAGNGRAGNGRAGNGHAGNGHAGNSGAGEAHSGNGYAGGELSALASTPVGGHRSKG